MLELLKVFPEMIDTIVYSGYIKVEKLLSYPHDYVVSWSKLLF